MSKYVNGEYAAEGTYTGSKSIIVKLQLDNDHIEHVEVTPNTSNIKLSFGLQKKFAIAVPEAVVGKPIDEVKLDKLAGSSKTTLEFNDALEKIKSKATN